jgi:hypothetical protein
VHAVGADGQRDVRPVVDQAQRPGVPAARHDGGGDRVPLGVGPRLQAELQRGRTPVEGGGRQLLGVHQHVQPAQAAPDVHVVEDGRPP